MLELQQAFDAFDIEHRGYLTPEMVGTILGCFDQTISQTRILEIVNEVDEDGKANRLIGLAGKKEFFKN